jgi:hypothetical protein
MGGWERKGWAVRGDHEMSALALIGAPGNAGRQIESRNAPREGARERGIEGKGPVPQSGDEPFLQEAARLTSVSPQTASGGCEKTTVGTRS